MGGHIECFFDIVSFFSYVAFADLLPNLSILAEYGVTVEFRPVLVSDLQRLSGNPPPTTVEAKAKYLSRDSQRAARRAGKPEAVFPKEYASIALTESHQCALLFIQANLPTWKYLLAMQFIFDKFWTPPHVNLTKDEELAEALADAVNGGERIFGEEDVRMIMDGRAQMTEVLHRETKRAVELGSFGAPWLMVKNDKGESDQFFGSDRFNHIYEFLGLEYQDVKILNPS